MELRINAYSKAYSFINGLAGFHTTPTGLGKPMPREKFIEQWQIWVGKTALGGLPQIGADPEMFVIKGRNTLVSAQHEIGTTVTSSEGLINKSVVDMIVADPYSGWYYADGYQFEIGIAPKACLSYAVDNLRAGLLAMWKAGYTPAPVSHIKLTPTRIKRFGLLPLGCRPSLNAYGQVVPANPDTNMRYAGGHLHFGWGNPADTSKCDQQFLLSGFPADVVEQYINPRIRMMDLTGGIMALALMGQYEHPQRRQDGYGRAGDYRINGISLEYRTPANTIFWHPVTMHAVAMASRFGLRYNQANLNPEIANNILPFVADIINNTDYKAAREIVKDTRWRTLMEGVIYPAKFWTHVENGFPDFVGESIVDNWKLKGGWIAHSEAPNASVAKFNPTK